MITEGRTRLDALSLCCYKGGRQWEVNCGSGAHWILCHCWFCRKLRTPWTVKCPLRRSRNNGAFRLSAVTLTNSTEHKPRVHFVALFHDALNFTGHTEMNHNIILMNKEECEGDSGQFQVPIPEYKRSYREKNNRDRSAPPKSLPSRSHLRWQLEDITFL